MTDLNWLTHLLIYTGAILVAASLTVIAVKGYLMPRALRSAPGRENTLEGFDLVVGLILAVVGVALAVELVRFLIWLDWLVPPPGPEAFSTSGSASPTSGSASPSNGPNREQMLTMALSGVLNHIFAFGLPIVYCVIRLLNKPQALQRWGLLPRKSWLGEFVQGFLALLVVAPLMWVATVAANLISVHLLGEQPPALAHEALRLMRQADPLSQALLIFTAVILAPVFEEIIFRGLLQTSLLNAISPAASDRRPPVWAHWLVILISAPLFMLVHGAVNYQAWPALLIMGIALGWLYERTGSIWPAIWLHLLFNAANTVLALSLPANYASSGG
jgi:membrane protease YdiL (CAAX protease family)